jgi:VanZ family protein
MATVVGETDSPGIRWALWSLCVAAWTALLVTTAPVHVMDQVLPATATFPVAKTGHVVGYAFLTVLSAWLRVRGDRRWLLLAFLSLHGMATEYVQTFVPERHGSWVDVGIDHLGIALGLMLSWKWWRGG